MYFKVKNLRQFQAYFYRDFNIRGKKTVKKT